MQEEFLKIAGHIPHPVMIAGIALVLAVVTFVVAWRAKMGVVGALLALTISILGLAPLGASSFLQSRGVYHVQTVLVRPDRSPIYYAQLKSSIGGDMKIFEGGWRLDIPWQIRPADGQVTLSAAAKDEFLKGTSTLVLAQDYYPTVTIHMVPDISAKLRGVVVDENLAPVEGAIVSIVGSRDTAVTDKKGNFVVGAHAGNGQMVEVKAQKGQVWGHLTVPAGKVAEVILDSE
jgi:hypothetical protein